MSDKQRSVESELDLNMPISRSVNIQKMLDAINAMMPGVFELADKASDKSRPKFAGDAMPVMLDRHEADAVFMFALLGMEFSCYIKESSE